MDVCPQRLADTSRGPANGGLRCTYDTNYSFFALMEVPTTAQLVQICASAACSQLLQAIKVNVPTECLVRSSGLQLYAQILHPIETACQSSSETASPAHQKLNISLVVGIAAVVCVVVASAAFLLSRRRQKPVDVLRDTAMSLGSAGEEAASGEEDSPSPIAAYYYAPEGSLPHATGGSWTEDHIQSVRIPLEDVRFGDVLSRGAFGEVLRGSYNGQAVAIKRLLVGRRKNMKDITVFLEEAKIVARLQHERIVTFVGVAWDSLADLCIVTEFMANGDLRSLLSKYHAAFLPTGFDSSKIKIATHMAHALSYLHSLDPIVVHRDLKSKNVMLTQNLDAKLTDFGASRAWIEGTMTAAVGSSLWMAPEVMMGDRYDEKADVFSFGVLLSELDTHELPYAHANERGTNRKLPEMTILQMVSMGTLAVAFSDSADARIVAIARACVALDPRNRPCASQVVVQLEQLQDKESKLP